MSILDKLTEGIVSRDLRKEGEALLGKWERTGLLEGLSADNEKEGMARLLENQAKQLLKEASSMEAGNVLLRLLSPLYVASSVDFLLTM